MFSTLVACLDRMWYLANTYILDGSVYLHIYTILYTHDKVWLHHLYHPMNFLQHIYTNQSH